MNEPAAVLTLELIEQATVEGREAASVLLTASIHESERQGWSRAEVADWLMRVAGAYLAADLPTAGTGGQGERSH